MRLPLEYVEVNSPDGILPGYFIPAATKKPAPVVIFYSGFDVVKEMLYCFVHEEFAHRGISCLVIDTPGVGEPLRLRNVPSRPDSEVPTRAIVDYLEARADVDSSLIGLLGISLGGYYAPRSAAFERRIKACVAWGAIWDMVRSSRNAGLLDRRASPFRCFSFLGSWAPKRWKRLSNASSSGLWPTSCPG